MSRELADDDLALRTVSTDRTGDLDRRRRPGQQNRVVSRKSNRACESLTIRLWRTSPTLSRSMDERDERDG